jgi:23S rRNA (uracil1939-C5)-methyltransferase
MKPATEQSLLLEKAVYGGDCLAHVDGKAVFVPLALPGETVAAHITENKRSFAKAELDQVLSASKDRVPPPCPHFGVCGGCHYQHAAYPAQLVLKQQILRETLTRAGVPFPAEIGHLGAQPWEYRNRIRLALTSDGDGKIELNYRSRRSHDLIAIETCPIAAPILVEVARKVADWLAANDDPAQISELELFTNHDAAQVLLTLFTESNGLDPAANLQAWLENLHAALPAQAAGLRLQLADGSLTPQILAASGKTSLFYTAAGVEYQVDHGAFFQVNRWLVDDFVALVLRDLPAGQSAWDLYAGVGLFARPLSDRFAEVTAVESAPASLAALERNLAGTSGRAVAATTLDFLRRNRENREPRPDLIVVDPPRAGLGDEITALLNAIATPELVYVSCDPTTLARDLRALTQERYRIETITLADMFPQTFHLETVVRLRRS